MNLPQLPRQIVRKEDAPGYEREIWQPSWKCFCCHDWGYVQPHLVALVIPGYKFAIDTIAVCQNPDCLAADFGEAIEKILDYRFNAAICQNLEAIEKENWRETLKKQHQKIEENIRKLAQSKSLRKRERNSTEEMAANQRHAAARDGWGSEAQNEDEQKWIADRNLEI